MKKLFHALSGVLIMCLILSCSQANTGNGGKDNGMESDKPGTGLKIETKDVKGIIQVEANAKAGVSTLVNDEGTFEEATVNFEHKAGLSIYPTKQSFDTLVHQQKDKLLQSGSFDVVELSDHTFYYKVVSEFGGRKEIGYNFLILISGKKKTYILGGEGENPLKPIMDKHLGDQIYHMAQTFVPAD